jgi:hypothetical protein
VQFGARACRRGRRPRRRAPQHSYGRPLRSRRFSPEGAAELKDGVRHRLHRRARAAERGDDDEFRLAERRQPGLRADGDRPLRPETRLWRANAEAAKDGADKA